DARLPAMRCTNPDREKPMIDRRLLGSGAFLVALLTGVCSPIAAQQVAAPAQPIAVRTAVAGGVKLQYLSAGHGPVIVLLHGFAETSRMWRPLIPRLAPYFTVIAPGPPGIGGSPIPGGRLDLASRRGR